MKTVLITGAAGFLGKYLIRNLLKDGNYQIVAFDISETMMPKEFSRFNNIRFYSLSDWQLNNKEIFKEIDIVIHLAFARAIKGNKEIAMSLKFTNDFFHDISNSSIQALINISTQEVYGETKGLVWTEETPVAPTTVYGCAKYASEIFTNNVSLYNKTVTTSLRLAGLLGQDTENRMVNKFVDFAIKGETINIIGEKQVFSQIDVRDAANAIVSLLKTPLSLWRNNYNLGYTRSYSITEIADLISFVAKSKYNLDVNINLLDSDIDFKAILDSSRFYETMNWYPSYDMCKIVDSIFEYRLYLNK